MITTINPGYLGAIAAGGDERTIILVLGRFSIFYFIFILKKKKNK